MIFAWSSDYSVHIKVIDEQHSVIVALANELAELVEKGSNQFLVGTVLKKLISFTQYHFATEEEYFLLLNYADAKEHIAKHREMTAHLEKLRSDYFDKGKDITPELTGVMKDWMSGLTDHIMKHDKVYAQFFEKHGLT